MEPTTSISCDDLVEKMNLKQITEKFNNINYRFDRYRWILGYRAYDLILKHYQKDIVLVNSDRKETSMLSIFGIPITIDYNNPETCVLLKEVSVDI